MKVRIIVTTILIALVAGLGVAQVQVGSMSGKVLSPDGKVVVGAKVKLYSPVALGKLEEVTDTYGNFRFSHLIPGVYTLTVESEEFQRFENTDILVSVNARLRMIVNLQAIAGETVIITGQEPIIEVDKTSFDSVITNDMISNLPLLSRDYADAIQILPGITPQVDGNMIGPSIAGGNGRQVVWVIDGVENVDDFQGLDNIYVSQEAIDQVQVITSGFSVEYGRGSAGVVNVVTKSGTDAYHGKLFGYYRDDTFEDTPDEPFKWQQFGLEFGGPIFKGQTNFYLVLERTDDHKTTKNTDPWGDITFYDRDTTRNTFQGRINHNLTDSNIVSVKFNYTPSEYFYPSASSIRPIQDATVYNYPAYNVTINDKHVFGDDSVLESTLQYTDNRTEKRPNTPDDPPHYFYYRWTEAGVAKSAIFGNSGTDDIIKKNFQIIEKYKIFREMGDESSMELTFGADARFSRINHKYDGDYRYYYYNGYSPDNPNAIPTYAYFYKGNLDIRADSDMYALYAQDDWKVNDRLTVNLGLRYDYNSYWEFHDFSPRAGFAWDLSDNGSMVLRGGVGVFKDRDILYRVQQVEKPVTTYLYPILVGGKWNGAWRESTPTTTVYNFADDMETPYVIDWGIGIDRQIWEDTRISLDYSFKDGFSRWYSTWDNIPDPVTGKFPDPTMSYICNYGNEGWSRYHGVTIELHKRYSHGWSFDVSYTWSNSRGNGYHYSSFLDNYVIKDSSLEEWRLKQTFPLNNDVPHLFKIYGLARIPLIDVLISANFTARSGYPFTAQNYATGKLAGDINGYRNPDFAQLDMRLQKDIKIGDVRISPKVDIFNVFNRENVASLYALENYPLTFLTPNRWYDWRKLQVGLDIVF